MSPDDECELAVDVDVVDEFAVTLTQFVAVPDVDEDDDLDGIVSSASDDKLILCKLLMRPGMAEEFFLQKPFCVPDVAMAFVIPHTNEV